MIICKEIEDYIAYANAHPGWINTERWQMINNITKPLLERTDIYFDDKQYRDCLAYVESNYYGLFPFQKYLYAHCFFYKHDVPIFSKFVIVMGRGNGKDGLIMPLTNFFQTPLYGVKGYNIDIVANAEDQAQDSFNVVYDMLTEKNRVKPKWKGKFAVTKELIIGTATKSRLKYNTSNAKTKDGKKIGCLVLNEVHEYPDYSQINVFESAFGKIKHRREFVLTTSGYVREGPYDDMLRISKEILETGENDLGWFPFICKLDDEAEADDMEAMHKANPSMEYMPNLEDEIRKHHAEAKKIPQKWAEYLTKRCNLPAQRIDEEVVTSWENILRCCFEGDTAEELDKRIPRVVPETRGKPAIIGIDYADINDFISVGVLTKDEEDYIWQQHTYICGQSRYLDQIKFPLVNVGQEGFTDFEVVDFPVVPISMLCDRIEALMMAYDVKKVILDTYRYTLFKAEFEARGWTVESKTNPGGLLRLVRRIASVNAMIAPYIIQQFELGHIIYGNSAIMRWYTNNTELLTDKLGNKQFGKIEPKLRKNDGFSAMDVAFFGKDLLEEVIWYV